MSRKSKFTLSKMIEVLDAILTHGSLGRAAEVSGIDSWTLSRWRIWSEFDGREEFQAIEYRGTVQPFHLHVQDAIEQSIDEIESNFRASARDGIFRPVVWHGDFAYEDDEYAHSLTEVVFKDMLDLGIVWPDKKKRVLNSMTGMWERVKIMQWEPPSVDRQIKVLSSWSERYADKRSITANVNFQNNLGVTVVQPQPAQLVEIVTPLITDAATDGDFAEIDGVERPDEIEPAETNRAEVEEQPAEPPSAADMLTREQRDIMERLRSSNPLAVELAAKAEENLKRRIASGDPDVDPRRTGRGIIDRSRGVKMV